MKLAGPRLSVPALVVLWAVATGLFAAGCPPPDPPPDVSCTGSACADATPDSCSDDRDCEPGERCVEGTCRAATGCDGDADCPAGEVCIAGGCYERQPDTGPRDVVDTVDDAATDGDAGEVDACSGCILRTDAGAKCVDGTDKGACGRGGETCTLCDDGEKCCTDPSKCTPGTCVDEPCNPTTCPNGCCNEDGCQPGDERKACGTGGGTCDECSTGEACRSGSCVDACNPQNCNGCCDGRTCIEKTDAKDCGANGQKCVPCGTNEICVNGSCVTGCSSCNSGCCNDNGMCVSGTSDAECGAGGNSCWKCPKGWSCNSQVCEVERTSRWDLIAIAGQVPAKDSDGDYWDTSSNEPDVFLEVTVHGSTQTKMATTKTIDGDRTPTWYETTVSDVRAPNLKGARNVEFKLVDDDFWFDDDIAHCRTSFQDSDFVSSVVTVVCNGDQSGPNPVTTRLYLRLRLH